MLKLSLAMSVFGLVALHMVEPGSETVKVPDTIAPEILYNRTAVVVAKSATSSLILHLVFYSFALYFVFHQISKSMLRLVTGFDSAVIVFSSAMCEVAVLHELIFHYNAANKVFSHYGHSLVCNQKPHEGHITLYSEHHGCMDFQHMRENGCSDSIHHLLKLRLFQTAFPGSMEQTRDMRIWRVQYLEGGIFDLFEKHDCLRNKASNTLSERALICRVEFPCHRPR